MPAGYASQTGYQYDSISRVAGQRELAPPSKFSNDGGFRNNVFNGMYLRFYTTTRPCYLNRIGLSGYTPRPNGPQVQRAEHRRPRVGLPLNHIHPPARDS